MQSNQITHENTYRLEQRQALISELNNVKSEIDVAQRNFNCVCDPDTVDVYIYRLRCANARYDTLLKKIKDLS